MVLVRSIGDGNADERINNVGRVYLEISDPVATIPFLVEVTDDGTGELIIRALGQWKLAIVPSASNSIRLRPTKY